MMVACQQGQEHDSAVATEPEPAAAPVADSSVCAPGTDCLTVGANGAPDSGGTYVAQCSSRFPDFVQAASSFPVGYGGPWFDLADDFPAAKPTGDLPWTSIDFQTDPDAYLYALRDYAFDGMIAADFRPQDNNTRAWFHVPMMNFSRGAREFVHGLTSERPLSGPELGLKEGTTVHNYAIGFYNDFGAYSIGQVWKSSTTPDISASEFEEGSMVFKILFTAATCDDFSDPNPCIVDGAPEWQIATGNGAMTTVRLLQMDVATRDGRSPTGWIYGTFAFDTSATDPIAWNRMRPVGLMWGNDPGVTPTNGQQIKESLISDQVPAYAKAHLGWAGRLNGPVDNPISACLSCHGTSQYPIDAALAPWSSACDTDTKKLYWFRNLAVGEAFGAIDATDCSPTTMSPAPVSLGTSLQIEVSVQNVLQKGDKNPCATLEPLVATAEATPAVPTRHSDAPRVSRGGEE